MSSSFDRMLSSVDRISSDATLTTNMNELLKIKGTKENLNIYIRGKHSFWHFIDSRQFNDEHKTVINVLVLLIVVLMKSIVRKDYLNKVGNIWSQYSTNKLVGRNFKFNQLRINIFSHF